MNDTVRPMLLEDALRGYLSRRCKRAYAHEMRNGLQGIYGGVDALTRAARSDKPMAVPLERLTQFVQQAIANHQRGLDEVLESMAAEEQAVAPIGLKAMLIDLLRFLTHDAARHNVRSKLEFDQELIVEVAPAKLRLILLGLLTDAVDSMTSGGELLISGQRTDGHVQIQFTDARTDDQPPSFVLDAIDHVAAQLAGRIDRKFEAGVGYRVILLLPAFAQP